MKQQYYIKTREVFTPTHIEEIFKHCFEPVDIGWRFCKDELPDETGKYWAKTNCGVEDGFMFNRIEGEFEKNPCLLDVVQWYKMPEPLNDQ